jgi:hypothetical protein
LSILWQKKGFLFWGMSVSPCSAFTICDQSSVELFLIAYTHFTSRASFWHLRSMIPRPQFTFKVHTRSQFTRQLGPVRQVIGNGNGHGHRNWTKNYCSYEKKIQFFFFFRRSSETANRILNCSVVGWLPSLHSKMSMLVLDY